MVALVKSRRTVTSLAKELGASRTWIYDVFTGEAPEPGRKKWTEAISAVLGIEWEVEDEDD